MKTVMRIEMELDNLVLGWMDEDTGNFELFEDMSDEAKKSLCARKDFREIILYTLEQFQLSIQESIGKDLESIWKRLDAIEKKR